MFLKEELRKQMLAQRDSLTPEEVEAGGQALLRRLQKDGFLEQVKAAFVYVSGKNEVSTFPLIRYLLAHDIRVCVPKTLGKGLMEAHWIRNLETDLQPGAYGILAPVTDDKASAEDIDLVIVPGVAFDRNGNRLGYGGGYYDRFFAGMAEEAEDHGRFGETQTKFRKVGVCYSFQMVEHLATVATDVAMDAVIEVARCLGEMGDGSRVSHLLY